MTTYLLYIASTLGAITTIIGFISLINKNLRTWIVGIMTKKQQEVKIHNSLDMLQASVNSLTEALALIKNEIVSMKDDIALVKNGTKDELRTSIMSSYYKYVECDEVPSRVKKTMSDAYISYSALGGDSYVTDCVDEIKSKPTKVETTK